MRQSIPKSILIQTRSVEEAMDFSNDYAPEHLILHLRDAKAVAERVQNAGSVFVGQYSPERWVRLSLVPTNDHNNYPQLWRLRLWHKSHAPNKWIRPPIQRGQYPVVPKTHYFPRTHSRRAENTRTHCCHPGRRRRTWRPRQCSQNSPPRDVNMELCLVGFRGT